jgi:Kef-type K+ transport system membrane component KefB
MLPFLADTVVFHTMHVSFSTPTCSFVLANFFNTRLFTSPEPSVIAEVVTGIVLGPSIMGRVPGFTDTVFPESSLQVFGVVANLGLIFFMFLIGLEVDPRLLTSNLRSSFVISISAMLAPFFLGIAVSTYIYEEVRMVIPPAYPNELIKCISIKNYFPLPTTN